MSWEFIVQIETQQQLPAAKAWKWVILSQGFSSQLWKALGIWSCYPSVLSLLNNSALSGCLPPHSQLQHSQSDVLSFSPAWKSLSEHIQLLAVSLMTVPSCSGLMGRTCQHRDKFREEPKPVAWIREQESFFFGLFPCSCQWLTCCWGHSSLSNLRNCILGTAVSIVACKTCTCFSSLLQLMDSYLLMATLQFVGMHCWDAVLFQLFPGEQCLYLRLLLRVFFSLSFFFQSTCEFLIYIHVYMSIYTCVYAWEIDICVTKTF